MNSQEKKLSCLETTGLAVGFTIGSGIITQTGIGIAMTGRSIVLAFLVSALLFLISFRPGFHYEYAAAPHKCYIFLFQ